MLDTFKNRIKGTEIRQKKKTKSTPKRIENIAFNIKSQEEDKKIAEQYQNSRSNSLEKSPDLNKIVNPPQCDLETFIPKKTSKHHKTLIIDLDETLVHSYFEKSPPRTADVIFDILIGDIPVKVFTLIRPGAIEFLEKMSNFYEIVIFTASLNQYANPLLDIIDKKNCCNFRLFREHCCPFMNKNMPSFTKDLKKLGRDMKNIIILDNNPNSYMLNPDNGVPIKTWLSDLNDTELYKITPYLEFLSKNKINDVREIIKKVKLGRLIKYDVFDQIIKEHNEEKNINVNVNVNLNFDVKLNLNVQQNINENVGKLEKEIEPMLKEKIKNSIRLLEDEENKNKNSDELNGFNQVNMEKKEKQNEIEENKEKQIIKEENEENKNEHTEKEENKKEQIENKENKENNKEQIENKKNEKEQVKKEENKKVTKLVKYKKEQIENKEVQNQQIEKENNEEKMNENEENKKVKLGEEAYEKNKENKLDELDDDTKKSNSIIFNDDQNSREDNDFNKKELSIEISNKKENSTNEINNETDDNFNIEEKNVIILDKEINKENENNNNNNNFFKQIDEKTLKENTETINPIVEDENDLISNTIKQSQEVLVEVRPTKVIYKNTSKHYIDESEIINSKNFPVNTQSNKHINEEKIFNNLENTNKDKSSEKNIISDNSKTNKKYKINLNNIIAKDKNNPDKYFFNKFNGVNNNKEMNKYLKTYFGGTFNLQQGKSKTRKLNLKLKEENKTQQLLSNNTQNNKRKAELFPINLTDKNHNNSNNNDIYNNISPKVRISNISKSIPKKDKKNNEFTNEFNYKSCTKNLSLNKILRNCKQQMGEKLKLCKNQYSVMNLDSQKSVHLLKIYSSSSNNFDCNNTSENPKQYKENLNRKNDLSFKSKNRSISEENNKKTNNILHKNNKEFQTFTNQNIYNNKMGKTQLNKKFPNFHKNFKTIKMYSPNQRIINNKNNFVNNNNNKNKCHSCTKKTSNNIYNKRINTENNNDINKMNQILFNYKVYKTKTASTSQRDRQNIGSAIALNTGINDISGVKTGSRFGSKYENGFGDDFRQQKYNVYMEKVEKTGSNNINKTEGLSFNEIEKIRRNNFLKQKKKYGLSMNIIDRNKGIKTNSPYGS